MITASSVRRWVDAEIDWLSLPPLAEFDESGRAILAQVAQRHREDANDSAD